MGGQFVNISGTTKIGSFDWHSFGTEWERGGVTMHQRHFINIQGGFLRIIMITYEDGAESAEDILAMFSNLSEPAETPPVKQPHDLVGTWLAESGSYSFIFEPNGNGERQIFGQETEPFTWGAVGDYELFTDYEWIIYRHWYTLEGDVLTIHNPMNPSSSFTQVLNRT